MMLMPCVNHAGAGCPWCAGSGQLWVPDFRRGPVGYLWVRAWLVRHGRMELLLVGVSAVSFVLWLVAVAWLAGVTGSRLTDTAVTTALAVWVLLSAAAALGAAVLTENRRAARGDRR